MQRFRKALTANVRCKLTVSEERNKQLKTVVHQINLLEGSDLILVMLVRGMTNALFCSFKSECPFRSIGIDIFIMHSLHNVQ